MAPRWRGWPAVLLLGGALLLPVELDARGRHGGGARISRGGPAQMGSMRHGSMHRGGMGMPRGSVTRPGGGMGSPGGMGRPGGGSVTRPADGMGRPDRPGHQPGERPGDRDRSDRREEIRDNRGDEYDERQEWWEDHGYYYRPAGMVVTVDDFRDLECSGAPVVVDDRSYYQCGPDWYVRRYSGGSVTYVVTEAPMGY